MGIQDYIFDVEHALEGKPEAQAFEAVMERFYQLERTNETLAKYVNEIDSAANVFARLLGNRK